MGRHMPSTSWRVSRAPHYRPSIHPLSIRYPLDALHPAVIRRSFSLVSPSRTTFHFHRTLFSRR